MVALSYRIFILVHLLVDYAFGAAIRIAYGDRDGSDEDGRDGARSAVRSGGCCAAKTAPPQKTLRSQLSDRAPFGEHPPKWAQEGPITSCKLGLAPTFGTHIRLCVCQNWGIDQKI